MPRSPIALHWFRRNLRLSDNPSLHQAAENSDQVVPFYLLSSWKSQHRWTGPARQQFLSESLASLAANLEALGSRLILRSGAEIEVIEQLLHDTGATALYLPRDYDPYGRQLERQVESLCDRLDVSFHSVADRLLHEPEEFRTGSGGPYRVYTPYSRQWLAASKPAPLPAVRSLGPAPAATLSSLPVPDLAHWELSLSEGSRAPGGERAARKRMKQFLGDARLRHYHDDRDTPSGVHTSQLSPDLRFGLIGIRELHARCLEASESASPSESTSILTYRKELAWREFYAAILWHFPKVLEVEFNPDWRELTWPGDEDAFDRWAEGRTGFPIVDAGMRQLRDTGFMHNRLRMIVSMFLTKDLHCDWRHGESYFMQQLLDGEIASNNGGWQWSAGTGADAAPYFRIQNPWLQAKRHDPQGHYIRQWVPELERVPTKQLFEAPAGGRPIADDYPLPMVDHSRERDRTLALFKKARRG